MNGCCPMKTRFFAAALIGLSIAFISGCSPWTNDVLHLAGDMKDTVDEYNQEQHEERVEELNKEYEEFLKSKDKSETNDDESGQSIMRTKDDTPN